MRFPPSHVDPSRLRRSSSAHVVKRELGFGIGSFDGKSGALGGDPVPGDEERIRIDAPWK